MTAQYKYDNYPDDKLAKAVDVALKASDGAGKAQAIVAGQLLAVGRKRYPADFDFRKWLKLTDNVGLRRARDLIAIAEGRKDWDKHLADNREAAYRYRDKVKAERQEAKKLEANVAASRHAAKAEKQTSNAILASGDEQAARQEINRLNADFKKHESEELVHELNAQAEKEADAMRHASKVAMDQAFEQTVVKVGDDPSVNPEGFNAIPFAKLPAVKAPPITKSDIEEDEAARMDVALLKRAQIIALDMVAKGKPLSSDGALASFKVACEMYLSSDVMDQADQKEALAFARLCINDYDDADDEITSVSDIAGWWPPIYAEAA
jgi:hypothetical protein